jgi:hypothetical protein
MKERIDLQKVIDQLRAAASFARNKIVMPDVESGKLMDAAASAIEYARSAYSAHEPTCVHPFARLGIDANGVMWCTECFTKPLVIPPPFGDSVAPPSESDRGVKDSLNTARQAFEHWYSDEGENPRAVERSGDGYLLAQAHSSWSAWQAAWNARPVLSPRTEQEIPDGWALVPKEADAYIQSLIPFVTTKDKGDFYRGLVARAELSRGAAVRVRAWACYSESVGSGRCAEWCKEPSLCPAAYEITHRPALTKLADPHAACTGCGVSRPRCEREWKNQRKCCPDCSHCSSVGESDGR